MRLDVLFAGVALGWTREYASICAAKLKDMGYCVRLAAIEACFVIAYSHRTFTVIEMNERLQTFLED